MEIIEWAAIDSQSIECARSRTKKITNKQQNKMHRHKKKEVRELTDPEVYWVRGDEMRLNKRKQRINKLRNQEKQ